MTINAAHALRKCVAADLLWKPAGALRGAVLIILGTIALALSAKAQLPFWPVPMTLQSLAVILIGIAYGSALGTATVLAYLLEGFAGLPVFAGPSAGAAYFAGPTAGFLIGFVLAAACVGWLAEQGWDRTLPRAIAAMTLGHVLLFVPGVVWLAVAFGWPRAVAFGVTPFLAATLVKTALGAALVAAFWSVLARRLSER